MTRKDHHRRHRSGNTSMQSICGDIKIRGNHHQIAQKYSDLADQAMIERDVVVEQQFRQHAEHYTRMHNERAEHHVAG